MGVYQLDFKAVKENDFSVKKQNPMWSGQDVLSKRLDYQKSLDIIQRIN